MTDDARFTRHVIPVLISASTSREISLDRLGQLIADAVRVADVPMVAEVAMIPDEPGEYQQVAAYARRTGQPVPDRLASFAVALHVAPDTTTDQVEGLIVAAYSAITAQVDAAHTSPIQLTALALDEAQLHRAAAEATRTFRTG